MLRPVLRRTSVAVKPVVGISSSVIVAPLTSVDITKYAYTRPYLTPKSGLAVVHDPKLNKGTSFPIPERDRLGIRGLVPPRTLPLSIQKDKVYSRLLALKDPFSQHLYLASLQDRNETLFFRLLIDKIEELAPIVYTPVVGKVCQTFGTNFRRTRGMYFCSADRGQMTAMMHNWPEEEVQIVVVTDGSRILGLGDLGANGMGISIGKLALYVAAGGISPARVLPVMLDCGTDNKELALNPHYLGMPHPRLQGDAYYSMVHEFVNAIHNRWPDALIQFEDFSSDKAANILHAYRDDHLCFNDDIQGTGATTLAGLLSAIQFQGSGAQLKDQRFVVVGAGSAGIGVSNSVIQGMGYEGISEEEAAKRFWLVDQFGLVGEGRPDDELTKSQRRLRRDDCPDKMNLLEVVKEAKPTIILGLTGVGGTFTEEIIREMASHVDKPIVFPLSNPTDNAECTASEAYEWTDGRGIFASGSPFDPVEVNGKKFNPSQCNNMFIFPGVGFGATMVKSKVVSDRMFYEAALALAHSVTEEDREAGCVFPRVSDIRRVSRNVSIAVAQCAVDEGHARECPADIPALVTRRTYDPKYSPLVTS